MYLESVITRLLCGTAKPEELHEGGPSLQAVRLGKWKAVHQGPSSSIEPTNLESDLSESKDLAKFFPELVATANAIMTESHDANPDWPLRDRAPAKTRADGRWEW